MSALVWGIHASFLWTGCLWNSAETVHLGAWGVALLHRGVRTAYEQQTCRHVTVLQTDSQASSSLSAVVKSGPCHALDDFSLCHSMGFCGSVRVGFSDGMLTAASETRISFWCTLESCGRQQRSHDQVLGNTTEVAASPPRSFCVFSSHKKNASVKMCRWMSSFCHFCHPNHIHNQQLYAPPIPIDFWVDFCQ